MAAPANASTIPHSARVEMIVGSSAITLPINVTHPLKQFFPTTSDPIWMTPMRRSRSGASGVLSFSCKLIPT